MALTFRDCELDVDARRLTRAGREVHLAPKEFELLKVLIECHPRALAKAELLERLWPGVFVSESSLAKVVSNVRDRLGDSEGDAIIRTVHGYGYAFAPLPRPMEERVWVGDAKRVACWLFCGSREFPLSDGEHVIGRDPGASITLDSPKVSRRHAKITVTGTRAFLADLDSKNGSYVRGVRVSAPTSLDSGAEVRIGPFTMTFRVSGIGEPTESEMR